ncbi:DUF3015 family protein [Marinospirillum sp.]
MFNMKKLIAASALAVALPFAASAHAVSDAGCGLGSVLLEGQDGLVMNVLAATLNGTSGNQTFGMTTGTLNCSQENSLFALESYINDNLDTLAVDAARGEGETLTTLATLWGVDAADQSAFTAALQSQYGEIFTSENVTSADILSNMNSVVASDAALAGYTLS